MSKFIIGFGGISNMKSKSANHLITNLDKDVEKKEKRFNKSTRKKS